MQTSRFLMLKEYHGPRKISPLVEAAKNLGLLIRNTDGNFKFAKVNKLPPFYLLLHGIKSTLRPGNYLLHCL